MTGEADCTVSIVLPVYNAFDTLPRAIESALGQTEQSLELLLIDDCSTDASPGLIEQYAARDARVRAMRMPQNSGPAAARNYGIDAARGRWIALLDSDDAYRETRLARLVALGEAQGADLVSDNMLMQPTDQPSWPLIDAAMVPRDQELTAAAFIEGNIGDPKNPRFSYGFMHPIFRRTFLERHALRYDVRNRFGEDFMLYVACLRAGASWWITPEVLYDYAVRTGSLTEVQRSGDLQRIVQLETGYLADSGVASDPALHSALRRHRAKIARLYAYRAFTDAIKARNPAAAVGVLAENRSHAGYIVREAMRQAPLIAAKLAQGGYLSRAPSPTQS